MGRGVVGRGRNGKRRNGEGEKMVIGEMGREKNGKRRNWEGEKEDTEGKSFFNFMQKSNIKMEIYIRVLY